jgi:hypothetical protein
MMKRIAPLLAVLVLSAVAGTATAQQSELAARCAGLPDHARAICYSVAQAAESAQPQLGVLIAGGNPTIGTATGGGITLPLLPRVSASAKANLVFVRLPDILARELGTPAATINRALGVPAPALQGTASIELYPGLNVLPGIGGVGSVDLLGSAAWLPFRTFAVEGFEEGRQNLTYGVGARLGLLREGFLFPGASVSVMRHRVGRIGFGDVCPGADPTLGPPATCAQPGTIGEFDFDLTTWSTRAVVSKRLLGIGLAGGVGLDRNSSRVGFLFRYAEDGAQRVVGVSDVPISESRWNAFLNGSYTFLLATVAAELGWMQGGDAVPGCDDAASAFDPGRGTLFTSLGVRIAF